VSMSVEPENSQGSTSMTATDAASQEGSPKPKHTAATLALYLSRQGYDPSKPWNVSEGNHG